MDWRAFFEAAGLGARQVVVAWQPAAIAGVAALVASRPLASWKDYLRFHVVDEYAGVLPRVFAFAQAFAAKLEDSGMRAQLANDHAPEMYRMDTVRNLDAWYAAFAVVPGQRLCLDPRDRVRIW